MASEELSLDVGFDREALLDPENGHLAPLTCGFAVVSQAGNPVSLGRHLRIGSHLRLTLYDLTGDGPGVPVDYLSMRLDIEKAREQPDGQPFALLGTSSVVPAAVWEKFRIFPAAAEVSPVFEGRYPSWNVQATDGGAAIFGQNQLQPEIPAPLAPLASYELAHAGYFNFTLHLDVRWTDAAGAGHEKHYREDPEMIIDTTGPVEGSQGSTHRR